MIFLEEGFISYTLPLNGLPTPSRRTSLRWEGQGRMFANPLPLVEALLRALPVCCLQNDNPKSVLRNARSIFFFPRSRIRASTVIFWAESPVSPYPWRGYYSDSVSLVRISCDIGYLLRLTMCAAILILRTYGVHPGRLVRVRIIVCCRWYVCHASGLAFTQPCCIVFCDVRIAAAHSTLTTLQINFNIQLDK